jgi:hypothetical protein
MMELLLIRIGEADFTQVLESVSRYTGQWCVQQQPCEQ